MPTITKKQLENYQRLCSDRNNGRILTPDGLRLMNTPPETVPLDRTNGAARPLKWCMVTADMVH